MKVKISLGILLLLSIIFNIYLLKLVDNKNGTQSELQIELQHVLDTKLLVDRELELVKEELTRYTGINSELDSIVFNYMRQIKRREKEIVLLITTDKNNKLVIQQLNAELDFVKEIKERYYRQIEKLVVENKDLRTDLKEKNTQVAKYDELANELLDLKVIDLKISTFKGSLENKVLTTRGSNVRIVQACFTIMENKFAPSGIINIYTRIIDQKGRIVGQKGYFTERAEKNASNIQLSYSDFHAFRYNNSNLDLCIDHFNANTYSKGSYTLEIYIDNKLSKRMTFEL